jgi:hypothetical protein
LPLEDPDYQKFRDSLIDADKQILDQIFREQVSIQKEIIQENIRADKEHLILVNFCIDPFKYKAFLHNETGYLFVRVEPFYRLGLKDFDIAIYNAQSKVLILVECKSSVYDGQKEVDDLIETIAVANDNHELLEEIVGDEILLKEFSICSMAGYVPRLRPTIISKNAPICLWSADIFTEILSLEKLGEDTSAEISSGKLHRDDQLRQLLLKGVKSAYGPTRLAAFLPSSHPCTILEEVCTVLHLNLEKSEKEKFRFSDVQNLLEKEKSLWNFSQEELWNFANKLFHEGLKIGVFQDLTLGVSKLLDKEFELGISHGSTRSVINGVNRHYMDFHATQKAEDKAVNEFKAETAKKYRALNEFK